MSHSHRSSLTGSLSPHHTAEGVNLGRFRMVQLRQNNYSIPSGAGAMRLPVHSFFYLTQGQVFIEVDQRSILLASHELVVIPAGVSVQIKYYRDTLGFMGSFSSDFITDFSQNIVERYTFLRYFNTTKFVLTGASLQRIDSLFTTLYALFHTPESPERLLSTYLACLLQEFQELINIQPDKSNYNPLTYRFLDMLFDHTQKNLRPHDFEQHLCVSLNHLNKMVRQATGKSLSQWITERMILDAKVLLRNSNLSIADIAQELEMEDSSYFARKFKRFEGISPSEYRQKFND